MRTLPSDTRYIAAAVTVLAALLIVLLLVLCRLSFDPASQLASRQPVASVAEMPEFAELLETLNSPSPSDPSRAQAPEAADRNSSPAPEGGADLTDAGAAALPAPPVTSERPSPVSRQERTAPPQTGPTREQQEQERARRRADRDIANAFSNPADNNTTNRGTTAGDSGAPDGNATPVSGSGTGTVGGGWVMPHYQKIPSTLTGSIRLRATIDASGAVTRVVQIGGDAPASADGALVQRCIREVQSKRYTRPDDEAPTTATALITYIFR